jgi:hypothetical protein
MLTYFVNLVAGELEMETDKEILAMDRKSDGARPDLGQSGMPFIGVIVLSLGLWAAIWQAVAFLR